MKGSGRKQRGRGAYFVNDAKEMLQKLTLIIAEMEGGNTSLQMRNMGQSILDALLHSKHMKKGQYQKLVKKCFPTKKLYNGKRNNIIIIIIIILLLL